MLACAPGCSKQCNDIHSRLGVLWSVAHSLAIESRDQFSVWSIYVKLWICSSKVRVTALI